MHVAIFIDSYDLAAALELSLSRLGLIEELDLDSVFRFDGNEADAMFWCHRMRNLAHFDQDLAIALVLNHRNMLLLINIGALWFEQSHLLTTAYGGNARIDKHHDNIAAMWALIKFCFHIIQRFRILNILGMGPSLILRGKDRRIISKWQQ